MFLLLLMLLLLLIFFFVIFVVVDVSEIVVVVFPDVDLCLFYRCCFMSLLFFEGIKPKRCSW